MLNPQQFIQAFGNEKTEDIAKFAKVSPSYVSGRPSLIFDGETTEGIKKYPYLSSYIPKAGDRVMVIKGVVIGAIK